MATWTRRRAFSQQQWPTMEDSVGYYGWITCKRLRLGSAKNSFRGFPRAIGSPPVSRSKRSIGWLSLSSLLFESSPLGHPTMATTKKTAPFPSIEGSTTAAQNAGGQAPSRTDAIDVEIPVVVHASRYPVVGLGASKALSPLHEKTHTKVVFPQGGVVRLSANLSVGELVVLTNQRSGADVLWWLGAGVSAKAP